MEQNNEWEVSTVAILDANASLWGVAISSDGTIYFTEQVTHRVRMVRDGQVTTVAGSGVRGYADGAALKAKFKVPRGLAISPNGGAIYVADCSNNRIRMIRDGQVTTVAGSGKEGYADGAALQAQFYNPTGLAISPNGGAIYVADDNNNSIRMIRDGQVTTVAGSGVRGYADGAALQAQFNGPTRLAISPNRRAIYVADCSNNRIRMIRDGQVTTVAGSGVPGYADGAALQAQFNYPTGLAISPNGGAIYVADYFNNRIRMICDGQVTTVAGSGVRGYAEGAALQAQFNIPAGLAISPNGGAIYVADCSNNRIRMIRDGHVATVAGRRMQGYADGAALQAQFNYPAALAIPPNGRENAALQAQFNYPAALAIPPNGRENAALQAQFNYPLALAIPPADHYNKQMRMIGAPNVFSLQNSAVDLRQAIDAQPSLFIKIGDISLGFHECLIAHRCPQLKQVLELTGSSLTIEARAVRALQSFVYTDTLPDQQKLCSVEWLCLMLLLDRCGFADAAQSCHQKLCSLVVGVDSCTINDVLAMYTRSLDLRYDAGTKLALYLLRKHKNDLPVKQLPVLMKDHTEYMMDLVAELVPTNNANFNSPPIFKPQSGKCKSLTDTLVRLYETREGADFNIVLKGHNDNTPNSAPMRCHAFVLHARWPYFRAMFDAGMREMQRAKLELPGVGEDGGMHPLVMQAILDVIYLGAVQPNTIKLFNPAVALQLLSVQELYLSSFDAKEQKQENGGGDGGDGDGDGDGDATASAFLSLIEWATQLVDRGLNVDNCVEVYKTALEMQVEEVAERSKSLIVANIKLLMANPKHSAAILSLPHDVQLPLLWKCIVSM